MTVVFTAFVVMIASVVVASLMFYSAEYSKMAWIGSCAYSLIYAFPLGLLLGILRVVYRGLGNIEHILCIVLETADNVAVDASQLRSGAVGLPSGSELVEKVYDEVVSPSLEKAIRGSFFFLGGPFNFVYQKTIGASVKFMLKRTQSLKLSEEDDREVQQKLENGIYKAADYSASVKAFTSKAAGTVNVIARSIRRFVMTPIFVAYCVLLLVAMVPLLIYRFWFGKPVLDESAINDALSSAVQNSVSFLM